MTYFFTWLQSNLLEIPVYLAYLFFFRKNICTKSDVLKLSLSITLINSITHPIVFFAFLASSLTLLEGILIAESFAVLSECFLVFCIVKKLKLSLLNAFLLSLLANLLSWQIAPLLTWSFFKFF